MPLNTVQKRKRYARKDATLKKKEEEKKIQNAKAKAKVVKAKKDKRFINLEKQISRTFAKPPLPRCSAPPRQYNSQYHPSNKTFNNIERQCMKVQLGVQGCYAGCPVFRLKK